MPITKERVNEIAMIVLQEKMEREGQLKLVPFEIKRTIKNSAKKMNMPAEEVAEVVKIIFERAYIKTIAEIDKVISGKVEE
jgi:hypothetical protein